MDFYVKTYYDNLIYFNLSNFLLQTSRIETILIVKIIAQFHLNIYQTKKSFGSIVVLLIHRIFCFNCTIKILSLFCFNGFGTIIIGYIDIFIFNFDTFI